MTLKTKTVLFTCFVFGTFESLVSDHPVANLKRLCWADGPLQVTGFLVLNVCLSELIDLNFKKVVQLL